MMVNRCLQDIPSEWWRLVSFLIPIFQQSIAIFCVRNVVEYLKSNKRVEQFLFWRLYVGIFQPRNKQNCVVESKLSPHVLHACNKFFQGMVHGNITYATRPQFMRVYMTHIVFVFNVRSATLTEGQLTLCILSSSSNDCSSKMYFSNPSRRMLL